MWVNIPLILSSFHRYRHIHLVLLLFRFRLQHTDSQHPQSWSNPAIQVLLSLLTCPLQQRPWDQLLFLLLSPRRDRRRGPLSTWHSHTLPPVKKPPPRAHWPPPRPHPSADPLPPPHQSAVPLRTGVPPLVQPGVGPEAVEHHPANGRAASRRPCHQGPHPPAVPGHPERVSDAGDGDGEWLQKAHRPRAARVGSVLPRATSPGGRWLLQHL